MLLEAIRFEARYDPNSKRLGISVNLTGTLVLPGEDGVSQDLFVPRGNRSEPPKNFAGFVCAPRGIRAKPQTITACASEAG
jgi:hypothetical protein